MRLPSIQVLPTEVVHLMAAGEVINSLAAAVRELAENAIDAQATRITISISPTQRRVRVADNGTGMNLSDLQQAATAHSTSKIHTLADLQQITSLGFRGEALHSLARLASLEICSREVGSSEGWGVTYNPQGEAIETEAAAIAPGTVVTVSNLFGNWAARREGLPSISQQLKAVQATIQEIALCHPRVTWLVRQEEKDWFSISPSGSAHQILPQILPPVHLSDLREVRGDGEMGRWGDKGDKGSNSQLLNSTLNTQHSTLYLLLGLPDRCHRRRADWVKVAVNGRMVRSPELEQTMLSALKRTLPRDRFPICFLHLQVDSEQIDWNRHPAKTEIYLQNLSSWQERIVSAIDRGLQLNPDSVSETMQVQRVGKLLKAAENKGDYKVNRAISPVTNTSDLGLMELKAIAQIHHTYIVAEHSSGLWLVEQHIAHERVLYEQLLDAWQLIPLEPPIILDRLSAVQVEQLDRIGLEIEPFGEQLWVVRTLPAMLQERQDCADALIELSLGGSLQAAQVAVACRSAIRNGTPLTLPEMQTLLGQWQRTRHPRTCPHGRPIYLSLEESALARFFRRHWVIGKSHGI
ncbi:MAG: DNA mismatch repair endonuclease MutL [Cyanosarcina radialis HA8281-LM2]|jgi:DNA mismatch repair protein MutL|nr:DNA mismatch repair endonuclease MutL [Cyanosarcina radialis HA8281-LM2]